MSTDAPLKPSVKQGSQVIPDGYETILGFKKPLEDEMGNQMAILLRTPLPRPHPIQNIG